MIGIGDASLFRYPPGLHARPARLPLHAGRADAARRVPGARRHAAGRRDLRVASRSPTAFRRELAEALPGHAIERIPPDDPLFTTAFGGYDIRQVTLRDPETADAARPAAARTRQVEPQLEGIRIDGRWAVIFSPYDISCALEEHEAFGCRGYTREDAARIGLNVLLYSLNQ